MKNSFQTWPPTLFLHVPCLAKKTQFELNFVHNCFRFHRKFNTCREKCQSLLFRDAGTIWKQGICKSSHILPVLLAQVETSCLEKGTFAGVDRVLACVLQAQWEPTA